MQKKNNKGITLVILVITILIMFILLTVTVNISSNRFILAKINNMYSDIDQLEDEINLYYMQNDKLPVIENVNDVYRLQDVSKIKKEVFNVNDNEKYYIIDFDKLDLINMNYGKGYSKIKSNDTSDDIYILNEKTHTVYYYPGIEYKGKTYYRRVNDEQKVEDNIPPSKPEIEVTSGESTIQNEQTIYTSEVILTVTPGQDNWSGVDKTTYKIDEEQETDLPEDKTINLTTTGEHTVKVYTKDKSGNTSESSITVKIELTKES